MTKAHWSFWLIGVLGLLWNFGGGMNLYSQLGAESLSKLPESYQAIANSRPSWATAAFGISAIAGIIGCLLLLLKKTVSVPLLLLSLLGAIVTVGWFVLSHDITAAPISFGAGEIALGVIGPIVVPLFLLWYAKRSV